MVSSQLWEMTSNSLVVKSLTFKPPNAWGGFCSVGRAAPCRRVKTSRRNSAPRFLLHLRAEKDRRDPQEVSLPGRRILSRTCGWARQAEGQGEVVGALRHASWNPP